MRVTGGEFRGRALKSAVGPGLRPATDKVRQALFSMLSARGLDWKGARVADLFAGTGSLGIEALSRGAAFAWFVDASPKAAGAVKANLAALGIGPDRARVTVSDVVRAVKAHAGPGFQVIFADPPYGEDLARPCIQALMAAGMPEPEGFVLAEVEKDLCFGPDDFPGLDMIIDRAYGQTRIFAWKRS